MVIENEKEIIEGALKRIIEEVRQKRKTKCIIGDCIVNDRIGGNDIDLVEKWIEEKKEKITGAEYSITSVSNYNAYELEGNNNYLNDINIESLKSGDKIVIAWEGGEKEIEIK